MFEQSGGDSTGYAPRNGVAPAVDAVRMGGSDGAAAACVAGGCSTVGRAGDLDSGDRDSSARMDHPVVPGELLDAIRVRVHRSDARELVSALEAVAQIESRVAAFKAQVIKALVDLREAEHREDAHPSLLQDPIECVAREEVAAALTISCRSANNEVRAALQLCARPRTVQALARAELTTRAAKAFVDATFMLDSTQIAQVERRIIDTLKGKKPAAVRQNTNRAISVLYPEQQSVQHEAAARERSVGMFPSDHGMATIEAHLPCHEANLVYANLTAAAHLLKNHDRDVLKENGLPTNELAALDSYRADTLVALTRIAMAGRALLSGSAAVPVGAKAAAGGGMASAGPWTELIGPITGSEPEAIRAVLIAADSGDPRTRVADVAVAHVVLDLPTALGLADNPGELRGHGPIPAELVRELAADAQWQRWITDDTGSLINIGTTRYRPSQRLREFIEARDVNCRFPGCYQPAQSCDLDHATAYGKGGATDPSNLGPLCRRHHRIKTHSRWDIDSVEPDGCAVWLSPTGQRIRHDPSIVYRPTVLPSNPLLETRQPPDPREPVPEETPPDQPTPAWPDDLPLPTFDSQTEPPDLAAIDWASPDCVPPPPKSGRLR